MQDPYRIDVSLYEALTTMCEYLDDEKLHYEEVPEGQRHQHIYHSVQLVVERLESIRFLEMNRDTKTDPGPVL